MLGVHGPRGLALGCAALVVTWGALCAGAAPARGGERSGARAPAEALEAAARAVAGLDSVRIEVEAVGGTAARPDVIRCDRPLVRRSYMIDLVRPIARVALPDLAFWRYGVHEGAAENRAAGRWVRLLAHPKGKELTQLVRPVEQVLREAARLGRRHGRWLDPGADPSRWQAPGGEQEASGHTRARDGAASGGGEAQRGPSICRVIGPWQLAQRRIVHVQNSGCLSGG